jgi:hypothetical protein
LRSQVLTALRGAAILGATRAPGLQGGLLIWSINGRLYVPSLMDMQRYFVDVGGTDYRQPMPIERLYEERYLNSALAEIGTLPEP